MLEESALEQNIRTYFLSAEWEGYLLRSAAFDFSPLAIILPLGLRSQNCSFVTSMLQHSHLALTWSAQSHPWALGSVCVTFQALSLALHFLTFSTFLHWLRISATWLKHIRPLAKGGGTLSNPQDLLGQNRWENHPLWIVRCPRWCTQEHTGYRRVGRLASLPTVCRLCFFLQLIDTFNDSRSSPVPKCR